MNNPDKRSGVKNQDGSIRKKRASTGSVSSQTKFSAIKIRKKSPKGTPRGTGNELPASQRINEKKKDTDTPGSNHVKRKQKVKKKPATPATSTNIQGTSNRHVTETTEVPISDSMSPNGWKSTTLLTTHTPPPMVREILPSGDLPSAQTTPAGGTAGDPIKSLIASPPLVDGSEIRELSKPNRYTSVTEYGVDEDSRKRLMCVYLADVAASKIEIHATKIDIMDAEQFRNFGAMQSRKDIMEVCEGRSMCH
jgi:hypothetical protein